MCGSGRFTTAFQEPPYSVRRCNECGFGWATPRLSGSELAALYAREGYWRSDSPRTLGYRDYRAEEARYLNTFRRRLRFALRDGPRAGRALDVGCAAGFCMQVMRELGFDAYGVDVSATIARHAVERFGFRSVHIGTLDSAPFPDRSFDLITMWDVIEHVVDPRALLLKVGELLKPNGLLVLETQNIDSMFARALGRRWHHYKHAEHIYHFTPGTLRALLESTGFSVQSLTPRSGGKYISLGFVAERAARIHPVLSVTLAPLGRFGLSFYCNVLDEMVAIARPGT
jgi:SAM-dependent methyltransferase